MLLANDFPLNHFPDPCRPPFRQHPVAIRHEVRLLKQVLADELTIGLVAA
jgi:hypothetical protein